MTTEQKSTLRKILLLGVPALVIGAALAMWFMGGRYESTDNAYVKADKIMVSPEISGPVAAKLTDNNAVVKKDQPLVMIDPQPFQIALERTQANLATVRSDIENKKSEYAQKQEELAVAQSAMKFSDAQYARAKTLSASSAVSKSNLDEAVNNRDAARANVALLQRESEGIVAQLDGDPNIAPEDHSSYKAALAAVHQATLDLAHTKILAPADGIVGNVPNVGDYARASIPSLSLVSTSRVWIEANFKETQLEHLKPGQKVAVDIDSFSDRKWHGVVESVSPATGSEFSILPAQNATGNWVKVVQRIAVRIAITDKDAPQYLRPGMSAEVKVDLHSL